MSIAITRTDDLLTVTLEGELNILSAPELERALADELEAVDSVVFDLTEVSYITSAGLRVLLATQQAVQERGSVIVRGACDEILEIFEMTGFDTILVIE